jgi:hypothetical protein
MRGNGRFPRPSYRIEHHSNGQVETIRLGYNNLGYCLTFALPRHQARLLSAHATGYLCLIEEETGKELARLPLFPDPDGL